MQELVGQLGEQLAATSVMEWLAVGFAVAYLLLAIRESIWCWPCALVSTAIYVYLFHEVSLLSESALNAFYLVMAVYGWWHWQSAADGDARLPISRLPARHHGTAIAMLLVLTAATGGLLSKYTSADFAYLDAATSWSAVWATWLTARKVLENWYYWLVIDVVSIGLYLVKGLALTAALFVIYIALIVVGLRTWRRRYRAGAVA